MKIKRHIPSFIDIIPAKTEEFNTLEELYKIDFVKKFSESMTGTSFYRFSISENLLIAEYNKGEKAFVVGYFKEIKEDIINQIPKRIKKEIEV